MTMTPTMAHLRQSYEALRKELERLEFEHQTANENEAKFKLSYEREYAKAFLLATGSVKEREAKARLETIEVFGGLQVAIALRRSSRAAIDARMKELDCVTSQGHAYNRELKLEMSG